MPAFDIWSDRLDGQCVKFGEFPLLVFGGCKQNAHLSYIGVLNEFLYDRGVYRLAPTKLHLRCSRPYLTGNAERMSASRQLLRD